MIHEVRIPDIGGFEDVDVLEVLVKPGQTVAAEESLLVLSSDKATMEVPSPKAGVVKDVTVKAGGKVSEGEVVLTLESEEEDSEEPSPRPSPASGRGGKQPAPQEREVKQVPSPARAGEGQGEGSSRARTPRPAGDVSVDVAVLGAGPGGYTAAFRAADLGLKVALIERYPTLGGVCLNVGCIPSKALLHAARVIEEARFLGAHGVAFGDPRLELEKLRAWKNSVVKRLTDGLTGLAKRRGVEVVQGLGRFASDRAFAVEAPGGKSVTVAFDHAILAVGSRVAQLPGIPYDDPRILDSTSALELASVPKRLLVIGGGIIGLEMATVYAALGAALTVVELTDGLIPGCDRDLVKPLEKRLREHLKATVHLSTKVTAIESRKDGLRATFEGPGAPPPETFDKVLVAVGRRPNGDRVAAEAAGLALDERGFVRVDKQQRTSVPHILAIGDLVGQPMLAHKASHEGKVAAEVAAGEKSAFDARAIPSVAYTDPEVAWVGLTETEAKAKGVRFEKSSFPWAASGRSLGMGRDEGVTQLLFDPSSRRLLGGGIVGPNAGDLIAEVTLAIEMGAEAADLGLTIHAHPTLSETVAFAAEAFEGTLTDLYLPKRPVIRR